MVGSVCDCESAGLRRAAAGGEEVMWLSWSVGAGGAVSEWLSRGVGLEVKWLPDIIGARV